MMYVFYYSSCSFLFVCLFKRSMEIVTGHPSGTVAHLWMTDTLSPHPQTFQFPLPPAAIELLTLLHSVWQTISQIMPTK